MAAKKKTAKKGAKKKATKAKALATARRKKPAVKSKANAKTRKAIARKPAPRAKAKGKAAKTVAKKAPSRKTKKVARPRRDNAGHLDASYAKDLRARARATRRGEREPDTYVSDARTDDDLAEDLAEEAVGTMTSGEDESQDVRNQDVDEELGGPFVGTSGREEFARGTDASNPKGASREPFPRT